MTWIFFTIQYKVWLMNSMEQSPSEANSHSASSQKISHLLWNLKIHNCVHKRACHFTNIMEQSPFWEANSHSDNQEITTFYGTPRFITIEVIFWVVMRCSIVVGYHHFWGHPEDGGSMELWNIGIPPQEYMVSQPRRLQLKIVKASKHAKIMHYCVHQGPTTGSSSEPDESNAHLPTLLP